MYIIGSKGIPAKYGGFETFADRLVTSRKTEIDYIVTGMSNLDEEYVYNGARCVQFKTGKSVVSRMVHTYKALSFVVRDSKVNKNSEKIVYILGCRAGIFLPIFRPVLKRSHFMILANPDGAEWKRAKWNKIAKLVVWTYEILLVRLSDQIICDAQAMLDIIHESFRVPKEKLAFIAYGSDVYYPPEKISKGLDREYNQWQQQHSIQDDNYYLMVGRFVPENNYELVIKEFMMSKTNTKLVIISNIEGNEYYRILANKTGFEKDSRISFVGTVYNQNILRLIRANARAYIHGHEVGGTNPSLLESLGSTNVNLVYDVVFNKEVAREAGLYFSKKDGNLAGVIKIADSLSTDIRTEYGKIAKSIILKNYSWQDICSRYEKLFQEAVTKT